MYRLLALASLLLVTALAVNVQAAECDAEQDPEACDKSTTQCGPDGADPECREKEPTYGDCGGEVCAYGNETCIECSGPIVDDGSAEPTRGPDDGSCENCRDLTSDDEDEPKGIPGFGFVALVGALAAIAMIMTRK